MIRPPQNWSKISITRIPMGHEVAVTPLQMTVAMATIANGGKLITPRVVKSITTADGKTISEFSLSVVRQVISEETAQKVDPHGGYEKGKYIVSFTGFLPADHPEFVGLVVLDDAKTSKPELNYGGLVAGPIFARIAEKAARYLDLAPQPDLIKRTAAGRVASTSAPGH